MKIIKTLSYKTPTFGSRMNTIYVLKSDDNNYNGFVYSHTDFRCIVDEILISFIRNFECLSKSDYEECNFDYEHPYDNDVDTWNDLLNIKNIGYEISVYVFRPFDETKDISNIKLPCITKKKNKAKKVNKTI